MHHVHHHDYGLCSALRTAWLRLISFTFLAMSMMHKVSNPFLEQSVPSMLFLCRSLLCNCRSPWGLPYNFYPSSHHSWNIMLSHKGCWRNISTSNHMQPTRKPRDYGSLKSSAPLPAGLIHHHHLWQWYAQADIESSWGVPHWIQLDTWACPIDQKLPKASLAAPPFATSTAPCTIVLATPTIIATMPIKIIKQEVVVIVQTFHVFPAHGTTITPSLPSASVPATPIHWPWHYRCPKKLSLHLIEEILPRSPLTMPYKQCLIPEFHFNFCIIVS